MLIQLIRSCNFSGTFIRNVCAILILLVISSGTSHAQVNCGPGVPTYVVDLTGDPDGSFTTPPISRDGFCCSASGSDRCIHFEITLDSGSVALNFQITDGAIPPGALYYQINCGPPVVAGQYMCISGVGPHHITFCKPGNNTNTYTISAIASPTFPYDDTVRVGCSKVFEALGLTAASTTWNSIYPGTSGQYNNLLSCSSGCTNPTFTPTAGLPPYIDYVICGAPIASNCLAITQFCDTVRIFIYDELQSTISPNPATFCPGAPGALLTATPSGGLPPYSFEWKDSNGNIVGTSSTYLASTAGTYTVEIADALYPDCAKETGTVNVSVSNVVLNITPTPVNCRGGSDGSALLSVNGGTAPYNIVWSNGSSSLNNTGLSAGNYTVTVTDAGGCEKTANVTITEPAEGLTQVTTGNPVTCFGTATGSASTSASGGTAPYTYLWNNGEISPSAGSLTAGTYTVTATDANGCTHVSSIIISQPSALTLSSGSITNASCFGFSNGSATANAAGGTPPYSYLWSNSAASSTANNLAAGTYTVTATDGNGCTAQTTAAINEPVAALSVTVSGTTDVSCYGLANGAANASASGGTAPYTYQWNTGATGAALNNIPQGLYIVTATDANGCTAQNNTTVNQPAAPLTSGTTKTNVLCYGEATGEATVNASGGTGPYTYLWNTGSTSQSVSGIAAGTYTVTVTDANGCTSVSNATINQPAAPLSASAVITAVACHGDATGAIAQTVNGGTAPYSYAWSNGATGISLNSIIAGTYTVTITDAGNCTLIKTYNVTQPASPLNASVTTTTNVSCHGLSNGSITVNANGGTSPYSYSWNQGSTTSGISNLVAGNYTVTVTDANNCTTQIQAIAVSQPAAPLATSLNPDHVNCHNGNDGAIVSTTTGGTTPYSYAWNNGSTTSSLNSLPSGSYTLTVTDANGCTASSSVSVTQPSAPLALSTVVTDINCIGNVSGGVNLTVSGGTPTYSYAWSNGSDQEDIFNISAATYTVTVTDAQGCTAQTSATVSQPPGALSTSPVIVNVNCFGESTGSITLNTSAGTPPYSFNWNNGSTSENQSNLAAGTYTVTVNDANGCPLVNTLFVTEPAAPLGMSANIQHVACHGDFTGAVDITTSGGTSPYTYQWNNGTTLEDLTGVCHGTYTVTVTDVNGCTAVLSVNVTQPSAPVNTTAAITGLNCHDVDDGAINITVTGGTVPYSYSWSNGITNEDLTGLSAGNYSVTVTDANGCTNNLQYAIIYNAQAISTTSSETNVLCHGNTTGAIDITVSGGTAPFTFLWNNGNMEEDISNAGAGNYTVSITDANGCTSTYTTSLTEPAAPLQATETINDEQCYQNHTGSIDITPAGGTTPYSFSWNNGTTGEDQGGLTAGTYSITITDNNGCTWTNSFTVNGPAAALSSAMTTTPVGCFDDSSGSAEAIITGGTAPYQLIWSNGSGQNSISSLTAGIYTLTVTDANACQIIENVIISQPNAALSATASVTNVGCHNDQTGEVTITPAGGTAPYLITWDGGATGASYNNLAAGTYNYTVLDSNNCIYNGSVVISEPAAFVQITASTTDVLCHGMQTGSVSVTATGGTPGYQYLWNTGAQQSAISNLSAGIYTVTVTDINNCTSTQSIAVSQPAAALQATSSVASLICYNDQSGSINLNVTGGTGAYGYQWSNGNTQQDINTLSAGTYTVTVTDDNGCTVNHTATVVQPASALTASVLKTDVTCNGLNDGSLTVSVSGGVPPYETIWSTGSNNESISALAPGTYSVVITDANGCSRTETAVVGQPANGLTVAATATTASCLMNQPATVSANVNGGTAPYQYTWNNGSTAASIPNLYSGNFIVTVTDANGCTAIHSASVNDNSALNIAADGPTEVCVGTMVTISATQYPGVNYQWLYNNIPLNGATHNSFSTVAPGTYTLTATNNCGNYTSNPIIVTTRSLESVSISNSFIICPGDQAHLLAGGGESYEWEPQTGLNDYTIPNPVASPQQTTQYTVTVTDDFGCKATASVTVTVMCDTLDIPNGYSPNSDGTNDDFVIDGLSQYPDNTLFIYNRWGNLVYKKRNYDNKWNGVSNVDGIFFGRILPDGTYYYILDLHNNQKPLNGFVVIKR